MNVRALLVLILAVSLLTGCGWPKDQRYTASEAEQKFITFCQTEGSITATTRSVGKTQWIYVPLEIPLFDIKATRGEKPKRMRTPLSLLSLEIKYKTSAFSLEYDIIPDVLPPESPSYASGYNEAYTKKRQLIYQGIQETFFNIKDPAEMPIFFVVVVADITKGVATRSTLYLEDLRKFMTEALPPDEYYMREQNDIIGNPELVGDKTGQYLTYQDVAWPDFLTDQMKTRIKYKFSGSTFPPKTEPDQVIIGLVANTVRFYPFQDFTTIKLSNFREKRELEFSKEQLKAYEEKPLWESERGRMTVIRFDPKKGLITGNTPEEVTSNTTNTPPVAKE